MSSMADLQRKLKAQQFLDKATKAAERGSLDIALTLCRVRYSERDGQLSS